MLESHGKKHTWGNIGKYYVLKCVFLNHKAI